METRSQRFVFFSLLAMAGCALGEKLDTVSDSQADQTKQGGTVTKLDAPPSTSGQLLDLVRSVGSSNQILSGQESMVWGKHDRDGYLYPTEYEEHALNATGKMPAIFASDFGDFHHGDEGRRYKTKDLALSYAQAGSIVSLSYHICAPDRPDGCGAGPNDGVKYKNYSRSNIDEILTPGSQLNRVHMERLDEIAGYLLELKDAGVPVLWRPFHEMNGNWFWWGQQPRYKELWIQMYNHFEAKGLNNLVWIWSVNYWWPNNTEEFPEQYYPGDKYVDVLGVDIYEDNTHRHSYEQRIYNGIKAVAPSKPIGISENGKIPNWTVMSQTQPDWAFYMTWWGYEKDSSAAEYQNNYNSGLVWTQDNLNGFAPSAVPATGAATSSTNTNCVDDNDGDEWGWDEANQQSCKF